MAKGKVKEKAKVYKPTNKNVNETVETKPKQSEAKSTINTIDDQKSIIENELKAIALEKKKMKEERTKLENEKSELVKDKVSLDKQKISLNKRETDISTRELNAENEFIKQREEQLEIFNKRKVIIEKRFIEDEKALELKLQQKEKLIDQLGVKFEKIKVDKQQEIDKFIEKYKETKMKQIETEYINSKNELMKQIELYKQSVEENVRLREKELKSREDEIEKRAEEIQQYKNELIKREEQLNDKLVELEGTRRQLDFDQKMLKQDELILKETIDARVNEMVKETAQQLKDKIESENQLIQKLSIQEKIIAEYKKVDLTAGQRTKEELMKQIEQQKSDIADLRNQLKDRPSKDVYIELEEKAKNYQKVLEEKSELATKVVRLEQQEHSWLLSVSQLQQEKEKREIEEKRREAVTAQIEKYQEEVNRLRSLYEQPKEIEARIGVIEEPYFTKKTDMLKDMDEIAWIEEINQKIQQSGLYFNKRLLNSFHTALKTAEWSPLTVLAGVSGTGKSELPRLYSRFGGLYYLPLPVQPDWDSPQSLFGYFNSVDNRFNATALLRAITQFQQPQQDKALKENLSDSMFLVLLDEMNLAHVELYFSELLSKLETRRGEKKATTIDIDLGAGLEKYPVELSRNVLWVGTMNEDETTKSLSDKVLDRGNLISFPRPTKFERRLTLELAPESPILRKATWDKWVNNKVLLDQEIEKYKSGLEEINSYLEVVGRALGHRVWQSVENYISNHPMVIKAKTNNQSQELSHYIKRAFEEAIVHKVMPKLRGIETSGFSKSQCLEPIEKVINDIADGLNEDYQLAMKSAYGVFVWRSAKYLEHSDGE
jgi:hypothetical protein